MCPLSAMEEAVQGRFYYCGATWVWATAESMAEGKPVSDMGSPTHWQHLRSQRSERPCSPKALADRIDVMSRG